MRRRVQAGALVVTVAAAGVWGCASPGMPPGGPPDVAAPVVTRVTPESGAVNVRASSVLFRFDEVVSERGGGRAGAGAASGLEGLVLVSPTDGRERVSWRRSAIEVEPRSGFRANTAYRVTLLPGLTDLRGNVLEEPSEIVFATGAAIPAGRVDGVVFDWVAGRTAANAWVQAFRAQDSTFRWLGRTDSLGGYSLRDLAPGTYVVRAFIDPNNNRRLDEREAFDSVTVSISAEVADSASTDFYAFVHDTLGPRIEVVEPVDSTALRIRFDRPVAPTWVPDSTASFVLQRADSSVIALGSILPAAQLDSLLAIDRERADSIARAADTTARADTAAAPERIAAPIPTPPLDTTDTLAARGPRMARPQPVQQWAVRLLSPLVPGTYRLKAVQVPGLAGTRRDSDREITVREPAPPDTTGAPPAAPPTTRPPGRAPRA